MSSRFNILNLDDNEADQLWGMKNFSEQGDSSKGIQKVNKN